MKKSLTLFAFAALLCSQLFAAYIVVLKDGTRYKAKAKWTMSNGKAIVTLENGQILALNLSDIDVPKSEQTSKLGLGDVNIINLNTGQPQAQQQAQTPGPGQNKAPLGSLVRRRPTMPATPGTSSPAPIKQPASPTATAPAITQTLPDLLDLRLKDNFERAYENVGIFEHKMSGDNRTVRAEITADSEDKVFNAISATAFMIVRNGGVDNQQIDLVELFMKTTTGGAAGRFLINRADAEAINNKSISLPEYFVRKVIY